MGVKFTPDGQFFVFSLLDQTLKVCYVDSMKLLLNLYGHKLPVLSFDISSDANHSWFAMYECIELIVIC